MIDSYDFFKVLSKYDVRFEHILEIYSNRQIDINKFTMVSKIVDRCLISLKF